MNDRIYGLTSLGLGGVAALLAAAALFSLSWLASAIYLAGCLLAMAGVVYAFCARCPCRATCPHVILGKLALAFTDRQPGPYSRGELAVVVLGLLWIVGLPHAWLWRWPLLLAAFWALNAVAVLQIRARVCPACDNAHCPLAATRS